MRSSSVISANVTINHTLLKTRFFGLHFRCRQNGFVFNHFDVIRLQSCRIRRILQYNGHFAVQGHSRARMLVPIESGFLLVINFNSNLNPISHCFYVIADYWSHFRLRRGVGSLYFSLTNSFGVNP